MQFLSLLHTNNEFPLLLYYPCNTNRIHHIGTTMHTAELVRSYTALPVQAKKQVDDLIAFLQSQQATTQTSGIPAGFDLSNEPFIGLWRDREDMLDSTTWVRRAREQEWGQ
jgi:hypothetical protein